MSREKFLSDLLTHCITDGDRCARLFAEQTSELIRTEGISRACVEAAVAAVVDDNSLDPKQQDMFLAGLRCGVQFNGFNYNEKKDSYGSETTAWLDVGYLLAINMFQKMEERPMGIVDSDMVADTVAQALVSGGFVEQGVNL